MTLWMIVALVAAGFGAGFINAVVGSGTLITFPTLLFVLPLTRFPIPTVLLGKTANITNSVGLVPAGITSAFGYREEIKATAHRLKLLVPATVLGAVIGSLLLLWLPGKAFDAIVPFLIALSLVLVVFGPRIQRWAGRHHGHDETAIKRWLCAGGMTLSGMYGAYFGAAQGVLMIGIMNVLLDEPLQHLNGIKNVLGFLNNLVAVLVFLVIDRRAVVWPVAGVLAAGSVVGAYVGARVGRRMSPLLLRSVIVVVGVLALFKMLPALFAVFTD